MESSTGEPTVPEPATSPDPGPVPEQVPSPAPAHSPVPVPSLSLDDVAPATPMVPDLAAVAATTPATADPEPVGFDLGDTGYAETLARQTYGQHTAPTPPQPAYQQPTAPTTSYVPSDPFAAQSPYAQNPYAQPSGSAQANPYAQNPYAQPNGSPQANPYASNPYAEQNPYVPVPYVPAASEALTPDQERTWASAAHWSALAASVVGLGFLGPLLIYLIQGPKSAWVKAQAAESLNFEITFIISMIASFVAMLVMVGLVTVVVFPLLWLIFRIIATVATAQGRDYRYPVAIRLVK